MRLMNSGTESQVVEAALVLLFRIVSVSESRLCKYNTHRLFISVLILANITFEDDSILLRRWQRMANYSWNVDEIRIFVMESLALLKF